VSDSKRPVFKLPISVRRQMQSPEKRRHEEWLAFEHRTCPACFSVGVEIWDRGIDGWECTLCR